VHSASSQSSVNIVSTGNLDVASLSRKCWTKHFITSRARENPYDMFELAGKKITELNASVTQQYVFGGCKYYDAGIKAIEKSCGHIKWPITWIQGDGCNGEDLTGTQIYAISGGDCKPVIYKGKAVGTVYEDDDAKYCLLGGLIPSDITSSREVQTREVFEIMEDILAAEGMQFTNVVRTWMYLSELLGWYDDFNSVRTKFFNERGVFDGIVPASTGIGVGNPAGAALITDLFAVKPKTDKVKIEEVESPLQCSATDYKSSFSRAVEVALPDHRTIYLSGTASIEPGGKTVHLDDTEKQIKLTMEVTEALLAAKDMGWQDVARGIAYFKDIKEAPMFTQYCKEHNLPKMPFVLSHSDVCRDDLLFEIELDAIKQV